MKKKLLMIVSMMALVLLAMGCAGHYNIKSEPVPQTSGTGPVKTYVADYHFNDGVGSAISINTGSASGELAPYIKTELAKKFGDKVAFVTKGNANITIEPYKLNFNVGTNGPKAVLKTTVNGKNIEVVAYGYQRLYQGGNVFGGASYGYYNYITIGVAYLLADTLYLNVGQDGKLNMAKLPEQIYGEFNIRDALDSSGKIVWEKIER